MPPSIFKYVAGARRPIVIYEQPFRLMDSRPTRNSTYPKIPVDAEGRLTKTDVVWHWIKSTDKLYHTSLCYILNYRHIDWPWDGELVLDMVNAKCEYCGQYALHSAVVAGDLELVQRLLQNGAQVNAQNDRGETPLHVASAMNDARLQHCLLDNGADPYILDNAKIVAYHLMKMKRILFLG